MLMVQVPFCMVIGWMMGHEMDLDFQLFETVILIITVIVVVFFLQEGTSSHFKGSMLILCYLIVAASLFVHEDPHQGLCQATKDSFSSKFYLFPQRISYDDDCNCLQKSRHMFYRVLREKFVELYSQPILENLLESSEKPFPHLEFPPLHE